MRHFCRPLSLGFDTNDVRKRSPWRSSNLWRLHLMWDLPDNVQPSRLLPFAPRDVEEIGQDFELPKKLVIGDDLDILQVGSPTLEGTAFRCGVQFLGTVTGDH